LNHAGKDARGKVQAQPAKWFTALRIFANGIARNGKDPSRGKDVQRWPEAETIADSPAGTR
jgi:hypothetical protein